MNIRGNKAFTYIELLISSVIVSSVVLGLSLMASRVYYGIHSMQMKTISMNIAEENIELLKQYGFSALAVTPDSCITGNLSSLDAGNCSDNPWETLSVPIGNKYFKVYRIVQYAQEDEFGNIKAYKKSALPNANDTDIKMINVTVVYDDSKATKQTEYTSLITNKEVPMAGSIITGRIYKHATGGSSEPPGQASNATIYVVGHPEYTSRIIDDAGNYKLENVMPGNYILYASGTGFETTYYTGNPLNVTDMAKTYTGVDFLCPKITTSTLQGNVYIEAAQADTPTPLNTPTPGPSPTPACTTKILSATGSMSGKTSQWSNPENITSLDNAYTSIAVNNRTIYSEFSDYSEADTQISEVRLSVYHYGLAVGTLRLKLTRGSGANGTWADAVTGDPPNGFSSNSNSTYSSFNCNSASLKKTTYNITTLYNSGQWDWTKVSNLGLALTTNISVLALIYVDYACLEVDYCKITGPTSTPTHTPDIPHIEGTCVTGAKIKVHDTLSSLATSKCSYEIVNIDPSSQPYRVTATYLDPITKISYYKEITGVPFTGGNTTNLHIIMDKGNTTLASISGYVYNAVDRTTPLNNVNVYLSDPMDVSPTTSGGGYYLFPGASLGSWVLDAAAAGYKIEEKHNLSVHSGAVSAPNIYMYPVGKVAGTITDETTGDPVSKISVQAISNYGSGKIAGEALSNDSGQYIIEDLPAVETGYHVRLETEGTDYTCTYPVKEYHPVTIQHGITSSNKNFRVQKAYTTISGAIDTDTSLKNAFIIVAYPSSVTVKAHDFALTDVSSPRKVSQTAFMGKSYHKYYGTIGERDSKFSIRVPAGETYNITAYYSYVSHTVDASGKDIRTLYKKYKTVGNVSAGTNNLHISGNVSTWTSY